MTGNTKKKKDGKNNNSAIYIGLSNLGKRKVQLNRVTKILGFTHFFLYIYLLKKRAQNSV